MPMYPLGPDEGKGQIFTGPMPSMFSAYNKTSDLRYSGSTAPHFQQKIDAAHGRWLAGLGSTEVQDEQGEANKWYPNELETLAAADDCQGNGLFDAPGSVPNLHPQAGIFAGHASLPGYSARERTWVDSEVVDATTGRPIRPVLSGAVSLDSAAQIAFIERGLYGQPQPVLDMQEVEAGQRVSTVNTRVAPQAIKPASFNGLGVTASDVPWKTIAVTGAVGLAVGAVIAAVTRRKGK